MENSRRNSNSKKNNKTGNKSKTVTTLRIIKQRIVIL